MSKSLNALNNFGASHHFFHSKNYLISYEHIEAESVQETSEQSDLVEKCRVFIKLAGGCYMNAYHAPYFQTSIFSVGVLTPRSIFF